MVTVAKFKVIQMMEVFHRSMKKENCLPTPKGNNIFKKLIDLPALF